ncbi:hypothetical protein BTS2_2250 [Bacillus sp. TS-2]|nr:hypothetical protein BTS2_2250 [Bacillus sp. TS-2]
MKLYTKKGDKGRTNIIGGRCDKDHIRIEAFGSLDELNSFVGYAISVIPEGDEFNDLATQLLNIQHELFDCGGDLAVAEYKKDFPYKTKESMIIFLEEKIDQFTNETTDLEKFILPGGSKLASALHVCRTITRRCERLIVQLQKEADLHPFVLPYVNRLSDYFFAAARVANHRQKISDIEYKRSAIVFKTKTSHEEQ